MKKIKGLYTAIVTPFDETMEVDQQAFRQLIQRQLKSRIDGLTLIGTTGESPTLSDDEKHRLIHIAYEEVQKRCLIMVGTGSNDTRRTIKETNLAEKAGADVALIVNPYYNKPSQEGLYRHFKAIAEEVNLPLMIYNIPGRTGINLESETLLKLIEIPSIIGIKETASSTLQQSKFIEIMRKNRLDFSIMSGNDIELLPIMALGGDGVISVLSNLLPSEVKELVDACTNNDYKKARNIHYQLAHMMDTLFIETNPMPIKTALSMMGFILKHCRLPLCEMAGQNEHKLAEALASLKKDIA